MCEEGLKRLGQMLAEYQAQSDAPQEVCDQILNAVKESSVGEDGSRHEVQYVVGIEEFVNAHVFDSEKVGGEEGCTIFTEDLVLNKAEYKENSELYMSDYELIERNKAKIEECLKER